jgi:hypothetical protein
MTGAGSMQAVIRAESCLTLSWRINKREDIRGAIDISDNEDEKYD